MKYNKEYSDLLSLACKLSDCKRKYIYSKCRILEIVRARNIVIAYRYIVLELTQEEATSPFGMTHSSVGKIVNDIKILHQTSKSYRAMFSEIFDKYPILVK